MLLCEYVKFLLKIAFLMAEKVLAETFYEE